MKTVQWDPSYSKKIVMKGMCTIKVAFRIFDIPPKNLHTHTQVILSYYFINILWIIVAIHIAEG
jgi:hypothetical protein